LTYRLGGEVGAALGAARLARLALTGERAEDVGVAAPVARVVQPDPALTSLLAIRRRLFVRLYQDLKNTFVEYSA
jgi:xylulokinase